MKYTTHIATPHSVTVILTDQQGIDRPFTTLKSDFEKHAQVLEAIKRSAWDDLPQILDQSLALAIATAGNLKITNTGRVIHGDEQLPDELATVIRALAGSRLSTTGHTNFWNRLKTNQDPYVIKHMFGYVKTNGLTVCQDGTFIAYKAVNPDLTTIHGTNHFQYKIGMNVDPTEVCRDPHIECAAGLHAGSWKYIKTRYNSGLLAELRIFPEKVVSVPGSFCFIRSEALELIRTIPGGFDDPELIKDGMSDLGTVKTTVQKATKSVKAVKGRTPRTAAAPPTTGGIRGIAESIKNSIKRFVKSDGLVIEPSQDRVTIPGSVLIDAGFKPGSVVVFQTDKRAKFLVICPEHMAPEFQKKLKCVWEAPQPIKLTSTCALSIRASVLARTNKWADWPVQYHYKVSSPNRYILEIRVN